LAPQLQANDCRATDDAVRDRVRDEVRALCREFPIYRPTF